MSPERRTGTGNARHLHAVEPAAEGGVPEQDGGVGPASEHPQPAAPTASGRLATDSGQTVPVSVTERGRDLLLIPLVELGNLLASGARELVFESMSPRGLLRLHGVAEWIHEELVRFEAVGEPELVQRREYFRIVAPQRVRVDGQLGERVVTSSVDISGGGMLLTGLGAIDLGSRIEFRLTLSEHDPPVSGTGLVVRAAAGKDERRGILFEEISRTDRERLIHFVFDRQRRARAITRGDHL